MATKNKTTMMTARGYAKHRGISHTAVLKAIKTGAISLVDGKIDAAATDAALAKQKIGYAEALRRKTLASARLAELELAQKKGEVVELDLVRRVQGEINSNIRSRLLQLPSKLAQRLSGVEDMAAIQKIVKAEVTEALTELSEARW